MIVSTQRRENIKAWRQQRRFSAMSLFAACCLLLAACCLLYAHGDEDHSDALKPAATSGGSASRTAERNISTDNGQFQATLTQTPFDPRTGESVQFAITLTEKVEGGFAGGAAPLDAAKVTGRFTTAAGANVAAQLPTKTEGERYTLAYRFTTAGEYKLYFDVTTHDGRSFAADFPVAVVSAPVNWFFWLGLAVLTLLALGVVGGFVSTGHTDGASWTLTARKTWPVAAGTLAVWSLGLAGLWYFIGPRTPRASLATTEARAVSSDTGAGKLTIAKEAQLLFNIRTEVVKKQSVTGGLKVTGVVKARPDARAVVAPSVAGRVTLRAGLTVGSVVGRGEQIGTVEQVLDVTAQAGLESQRLDVAARQLEVEAQRVNLQAALSEQKARLAEQRSTAQQARTRLAQAQRELQRAQNLLAVGAVPAKRVEEAQTAVKLAEQEIALAEQQATILQEQIKTTQAAQPRFQQTPSVRVPQRSFPLLAPVSGQIAALNIATGQQVETGAELLSIVNLSTVWLEAQVFEKDVNAVRDAERATWTASALGDEVYRIGTGGEGRLVSIGQTVDSQTRTVPVIFEVQNPLNRLRDGMFTEIVLDTTPRAAVLSVPKQAVITEQGQTFVFIFLGGETFEKRPVAVGRMGQDVYEITTGVQEGERVVVEGLYQLRSTTPAT